jgi:predicted ATPase
LGVLPPNRSRLTSGWPRLGKLLGSAFARPAQTTQQRFINLIDVLYDQDKRLLLLGERPLREHLGGDAIDLARTRSRLGQLIEVGPLP